MSSGVCKQCGCSEIDTDPARGDAVCTNCGSVLDEQLIISEVQFQDNAAGGSSVVGQYVSSEGIKSHSLGSGFHHGVGKESRQITLQNGKMRIQRLGAQLKLNPHCIETAYQFFKMAVSRRITRGRKTAHVLAACVYIVCRTEGTSHMLLDFSDILQVDVYTLGKTYLQLSKELCINIPALDPCLYVQRFSHKLEFGDKTHEVAMTALRLVQRMKRDWMAQGRRPSGLCGAALLVASRMFDFNRTIKDMIKVVKIGEGTIRKRLAEFEATPSSQLTIDEFQKIDLEQEMDPPSFTNSKKKAKLQQLEEAGQLPQLADEIAELEKEIDRALEEATAKKFKRYSKYLENGSELDTCSVTSATPSLVDLDEEETPSDDVNTFLVKETLKEVVSESALDRLAENASRLDPLRLHSTDLQPGICVDGETYAKADAQIALDFEALHSQATGDESDTALFTLGPRPTAASLGLKSSVEECMKIAPDEEDETMGNCELDLTGIDDNEIDMLILTDEEAKIKTRLWMKANADYLKEQKEKLEREEREREEEANKPEHKKRKKGTRRKQTRVEHQTAGEAIERILQEKKISSKINYDVLKGLSSIGGEGSAGPAPPGAPQDPAAPLAPGLSAGVLEATPVTLSAFGRRFRKSSVSMDTKQGGEPANKKPKVEPIKEEHKPLSVAKVEPEVIIESGPVQYATEEAEDEADYYEDGEEEAEDHISAAQLMGQHDVGDYQDYGYEDDD